MILSLNVKNFAIIDNISIDFKKGMTTLTGATGAGKSLIIDAIGLLFGDRANNDLVRYGENKASIEGLFCDYPNEVNEILKANDIDIDDVLTIKREIFENGKSIAKINGDSVNASMLSDLSFYLGNIHTQFDAIKLVNPKNYFNFIDDEEINKLIVTYKENLKIYNQYKKEYNDAKESIDQNNQKLDYLHYQLQELKNAHLDVLEEQELNEKINSLTNHEKIFTNYQEFIALFEENSLLENLYNSINYIQKNVEYNKDLASKVETLNEAYYNLLDIHDEIQNTCNHDDFDVNQLDEYNDRLNVYSTLKRKYKLQTNELILLQDEIEDKVNKIENFDEFLLDIEKKKDEYYHKTMEIALEINRIRNKNIASLENDLKLNLDALELKNTDLIIYLNKTEDFKPNGIDEIDFLVSFNKGEKPKPLSKIASGGELSRFMLALKAISCDLVTNKTFIFDEIDTGVSGEIAQRIGERIKKISLNNQVICVTHLPQVASLSDNHILITKKVLENDLLDLINPKTITEITELDFDGKVNAISSMLSNGEITKATIELAKEMLTKNKTK